MPRYLGIAVLVLAAALISRLAWQGSHYVLHPDRGASNRQFPAPGPESNARPFPPWQNDVLASLVAGVDDVGAGKMMAAEMDVDRAGSILTAMRLQSRAAEQPFFMVTLAALDHVLQGHADDERMMDHVTQARVALAELRSSMKGSAALDQEMDQATGAGNAESVDAAAAATPAAKPDTKRISIGAPRTLAADSVLDPATLRGDYLDATLMPDTAEILLPPESRSFADGVRVENLTIAGAAQTLDGIRWRNVTFVGTHLRYESGTLDLQNVHFVNCRFGFPSDERGARLANALALGHSTITIE